MRFKITSLALLVGSAMSWSVSSHAQSIDDIDVKAYGSIRVGVDSIDAGTEDDGANGRDFLSRIGVKASVDLGNGLTGFGQVEYGIRQDNLVDLTSNEAPTLRLANIGLQGSFGKVVFGTQNLLFHTAVRSSYFSDGLDTIRQGTIRDDDLLQYTYKHGKFTFGAGTQFEGQDGDSIDQYQAIMLYKGDVFEFNLAYEKDNRGENKGDLWGARAWYHLNDHISFSAYTHQASEDFDLYTGSLTGTVRLRDAEVEGNVNGVTSCRTEERSSNGIYARYRTGPHQVHARYAVDSCDVSGDVDSVKVEYIHYFGKRYRVWVAYEDLSSDEGRAPLTSVGEDFSQFQAGARIDF